MLSRQALASLQWRYLEVINRHDCDASLPDINGDRQGTAGGEVKQTVLQRPPEMKLEMLAHPDDN